MAINLDDWAPLPDMSREQLSVILDEPEEVKSQLSAALGRLLSSLDDPNGVISAFSSYVE
jgi:hypothetical protein